MREYLVECRGEIRELYTVYAESEDEAREKWHTGDLISSEGENVAPVSVELEED